MARASPKIQKKKHPESNVERQACAAMYLFLSSFRLNFITDFHILVKITLKAPLPSEDLPKDYRSLKRCLKSSPNKLPRITDFMVYGPHVVSPSLSLSLCITVTSFLFLVSEGLAKAARAGHALWSHNPEIDISIYLSPTFGRQCIKIPAPVEMPYRFHPPSGRLSTRSFTEEKMFFF